MIILILAVFSAIYIFARKAVKNNPLKEQIDNKVDNLNRYLLQLKDSSSSSMMTGLSRFSLQIGIYSIIMVTVVTFILPEKTHYIIFPFISSIFVTCITLHLSIQWNQNHRLTIKRIYKNDLTIAFLLAPTVIYIFDILLKTNFYTSFFGEFNSRFGINGFWVIQFFWTICIILFMYLGFWIVSVPIYFFLFTLIFLFSLLINKVYKHIDTHIVDGLSATLVLFIPLIKLFARLFNLE